MGTVLYRRALTFFWFEFRDSAPQQKSWFNLDLIWAVALVLTGFAALLRPTAAAVLVVRSSSNGAPELWEVPVDGRAPRKLKVNTSTWMLEGVTLSPGGKHLAFVASAAKSGWEIWAMEDFLLNGKTKN